MRIRFLSGIALAIAISMAAVACAGVGPETRRPAKLRSGDRAELVPAGHCRILGIDIRQANIRDIESSLGQSIFYYRGDFDLGNCYVSRDGIFLEFYVSSTGIGYAVSKHLGNDAGVENCLPIDASSPDLINEAGLGIGLSREEVRRLLGPASRRLADSHEHQYIFWVQQKADDTTAKKVRQEDQLPQGHEVWLNLYSVIKVFFEQDRVIGFDINTSDAFR